MEKLGPLFGRMVFDGFQEDGFGVFRDGAHGVDSCKVWAAYKSEILQSGDSRVLCS
jgi:hypothetical protein